MSPRGPRPNTERPLAGPRRAAPPLGKAARGSASGDTVRLSCPRTSPRSGTHCDILRPRLGCTPTSCPGTGGMRGGLWRGRAALCPPTPAQGLAFPSPLSRCQSRPVTHPHPQRPALNPTGSRGICRQQLPPGAEPGGPAAVEGTGQAGCRTSPEGPGFQPRSRPEVRSVQPSPAWEG